MTLKRDPSVDEGSHLLRSGRSLSAISVLSAAHSRNSADSSILHYLACSLLTLGRASEAVECAYEAHLRDPESAPLQSNLLQILLYAPNYAPGAVADLHLQWGARYGISSRTASTPRATRRLNIGYVSNNFCISPDAFFLHPIIKNHDCERFKIFCYSNTSRSDWRTQAFRQSSQMWRSVESYSCNQLANLIRKDEIDLLVDCNGHFGSSPIRAFCSSPAPFQVSLPIYPATVGLPNVQYRVTDSIVDPKPSADLLHSEQLVRLPVFIPYEPLPSAPEPSPLPADSRGFITFGCFNRLHKVNESVIEIWSRILTTLPTARLLLHHAYARLNEVPVEISTYIRSRFEQFGVNGERILFIGTRATEQHLALYHEVDLALDTFPYAGMTTTCDALWMGVPVITLAGQSHVSRVGVSRLSMLSLDEWIARDVNDYARVAVEKARDKAGLRRLRSKLRECMATSPIVDGRTYTAHLEQFYLNISSLHQKY